ncbi:MAG: LamG-like jellyroll fold domain-containing protein [Verrucomicrobiota bacterium]
MNRRQRFADCSGNNCHGYISDINSRVHWVPGLSGNALSFGQDRSFGTVEDGTFLNDSDELTIALWAAPGSRASNEAAGLLVGSGRDLVSIALSGVDEDRFPEFRVYSRFDPAKTEGEGGMKRSMLKAPEGSMPPYRWTHVAATWKAGEFQRFYVNGELVAEETDREKVPFESLSLENWYVGADIRGKHRKHYSGLLDEVVVLTTASSSAEIQRMYQKSLSSAGPQASERPGGLRYERWLKINQPDLVSLYQDPAFHQEPASTRILGAGTTGWFGGDQKVVRIRGRITAPESGHYFFWLTGRGDLELSLSEDESKYAKQPIAALGRALGTGYGINPVYSRPFDLYDTQASDPVYLEQGKSYFIELVQTVGEHHNSNTGIAWRTPTGERELLPGKVCSFYHLEEADRDDDYLLDAWERRYGLDPLDAGATDPEHQGERGDFDRDGLANRQEYLAGTDPTNADSDGDGLSDGQELNNYGTDPLKKDEKLGELLTSLALEDLSGGSTGWSVVNGVLVADKHRASAEWSFEIQENGIYYYDVLLRTSGGSPFAPPLPVTVSINGIPIHHEPLVFSGTSDKLVRALGPELKAGSHTLSIAFDNDRLSRSVGIVDVSIFSPIGLDEDENGVPDWLEARLEEGSRVTTNPRSSITSPMFVEGQVLQPDGEVVVNGETAHSFGRFGWFIDVPLESSVTTTEIRFPDGRVGTHRTTWMATNPLQDQNLKIRVGDSLRFQGSDGGGLPTPIAIRSRLGSATIAAGEDHVMHFDQAGSFVVEGRQLDGSLEGTVSIEVLSSDLPERIPVVFKQIRDYELAASGVSQDLVFTGSDGLSVTQFPQSSAGSIPLRFLSSEGGQQALASRIAETGVILDVSNVPSIVIADAIAQDATLPLRTGAPDGYFRLHAPLSVLHLPEDVTVNISIYRAGVMFMDGTRERVLRASEFNAEGLVFLDFLFPQNLDGGYCHYVDVVDSDGTVIGRR